METHDLADEKKLHNFSKFVWMRIISLLKLSKTIYLQKEGLLPIDKLETYPKKI